MRSLLLLQARHWPWVLRRLRPAVEALPDGKFDAPAGLVFDSVASTLTHLYWSDELWLGRIRGQAHDAAGLSSMWQRGAAPDVWLQRLRERKGEDACSVGGLLGLLEEQALEWEPLVASMPVEDNVEYRDSSGTQMVKPLGPVLAHVFNHHTHHVGQACAAMTAMGVQQPSLDLLYFIAEQQDDKEDDDDEKGKK